MKSSKKQILWSLIFLVLVALTVYMVINQRESFSLRGFIGYVSRASWQWIALAFVGMMGFVVFEGLALVVLSNAFDYKTRPTRGILYSAPDIYFSAITPSATGGQPASAYFMMKDGISGAATTVILLVNLTLYTLAVIAIGLICFITNPQMFFGFSVLSKIMIIVGFTFQFILVAVFLLLVYKEKIVMKIATFLMNLLGKMHLMHNIEKRQKHLIEVEKQYKECADAIKNHKKSIAIAFLFNFLQRVSQILVSVCVFIGVGGGVRRAFDAFAAQGYVAIGSNSVPIPGAVGAADYLFIDGFGNLIPDAVSIELLSRGISFYCCITICGIITLVAYLSKGLKGMRRKKRC